MPAVDECATLARQSERIGWVDQRYNGILLDSAPPFFFTQQKILIMSHPEADPCRLKDLFEYSGRSAGPHGQSLWLSPASKSFSLQLLLRFAQGAL